MASPIVKGNTFGTTDTVTSTTLNNIVDNSTFKANNGNSQAFSVSGSTDIGTCVKDGGLQVHTTGQLQVEDLKITTGKVANNAITLAKMATQADQTVLANVSGGTAVPTAVPIVDNAGILINDDALGTSDTKGATQGNIKAYVDTTAAGTSSLTTDGGQAAGYQVFASGLKMAWGDAEAALGDTIAFPSGVNFTVAPTVQITYNDAPITSYFAPTADSVSTTNFVLSGSYASNYGPRYLAIGH